MIKKILLSTVIVITILSCNNDEDFNVSSSKIGDFNKAKELWQSKQIKNYKIKEKVICYCYGVLEWSLFVKDNEKDSITFVNTTGEANDVVYNNTLEMSNTVNDAFDLIEEILNKEVAFFEVEYDTEYGFPTLISIDYDENIVDEERTHIFSGFEEL